MGAFRYPDEVDSIDLGDGDTAEIKRRMSYGDQQKLSAVYIRIGANMSGASLEPELSEIDIETGNLALLELNIMRWNLTDREGNLMPINRATIQMLDPDKAEVIIAAIGERNVSPKGI